MSNTDYMLQLRIVIINLVYKPTKAFTDVGSAFVVETSQGRPQVTALSSPCHTKSARYIGCYVPEN